MRARWIALLVTACTASASGAKDAVPQDGIVDRQFEIAMVRGKVYNPWTQSDDQVELRSYRGEGIEDGAFVAPPIAVAPGQTLRVRLDNRLPACTEAQLKKQLCFNDTNLHTHGLWVSPAGNSDNVLVSIAPGKSFQYEYAISEDHPAGTFWYHPHRHGTGFVQVGSGMAGPLIVTGNRLPTAKRPGDVDILLRDRDRPFADRVLMFQQIQYGCLDDKGVIRGRMEKDVYVRPWTCSPGEIGRIESHDHDWPWRFSGRFTGINGKVQPRLEPVRTGRFERWRLIHAGTREPVHMRLFRLADGAPDLKSVAAADQGEWMKRHCTGKPLPVWQIAMDGLTRSGVREADEAVLFPGDRTDVLTYFPAPGLYCVLEDATRAEGKNNASRMLGIVEARGAAPSAADPSALLKKTLVAAAERSLAGTANAAVRQRVVADLGEGMRLGAFVWHRDIPSAEVTGYREAIVNIIEPPDTNGPVLFHMNGRPYDHARIDHMLPLGGVEQWHIRSLLTGHPMHIHVNPFQIVSIADAQGRDVADPAGAAFDADYSGMIGQWKDTIFVKEGHHAVFRTRYERFIGDFVIHCHILLHGDSGMMQNLRIYMPDAAAAPAAHH